MKVVSKTGFTPVRLTRAAPPYNNGEIVGLPPEKAREAVEKGDAVLAPIPAGVETYDVPGPSGAVDRTKTKEEQPAKAEIPADWENMHPLTRVKLAKNLNPDFAPKEGQTPTEAADEFLRAEVKRRAEAAAPKTDAGEAGGG